MPSAVRRRRRWAAPPGDPAAGAAAYETFCAHCHGADGTGGPHGGSVVDGAYLRLTIEPVAAHHRAGRPARPRHAGLAEPRPRPRDVGRRDRRRGRMARRQAADRTRASRIQRRHGPMADTSRRGFLMTLGLGLNAIAATLVAVPVLGFLLAPIRRIAEQAWIDLGAVADFPDGETRLATYRNPFTVAVGRRNRRTSPAGCAASTASGSRCSPINCAHLGCPGALVPRVGPLHVPVPWRRVLRGRFARLGAAAARPLRVRRTARARPAASCAAASCRRSRIPCDAARAHRRLARGATRPRRADPRGRGRTSFRATRRAGGTSSAAPALVCFVLQIVTGICLATVYAPSANDAWSSLIAARLPTIPLGWFLRAVHGWGSNFMVAW